MGVIDEFMERYEREYYLYERAAHLVAAQLDEELQEIGVRCIVTSRAKKAERLKAKCIKRNTDRDYRSVEEIAADIADLAGVRVALYFPAELDRVDRLIIRKFEATEPRKDFPEVPSTLRKSRFSGYSATHYRLRLKESELEEQDKRCARVRVEVQVASVLMHAWSEVEHDLEHKPLQGKLSDEEYELLDQLNGLVHAGEIALERLQKAGQRRIESAEMAFTTHYDLATHLLGHARGQANDRLGIPEVGPVDVLHLFLLRLEIDTPQKLAPYLHNINTGLEKQALADQVVERILQEDVSSYNILRDAQNELRRGGEADSDINKRIKELYFDFIFKWNELEGIIRGAIRSRREPIPMAEAIRYAFDGKLLNSEVHPLIQYLRMRRNQYVHSDLFPDVERLRSDLDMLIRVLETIDRMK